MYRIRKIAVALFALTSLLFSQGAAAEFSFGGLFIDGGISYAKDENDSTFKGSNVAIRMLFNQNAVSIGRFALVDSGLSFSDAGDCLKDANICERGTEPALIENYISYSNVRADADGKTLSSIGIGQVLGYNIGDTADSFDTYGLHIDFVRVEPFSAFAGMSGGFSFNFNSDSSFGLVFLNLALGAI